MNNIRLYIAALLLIVSSMAKAQVAEPYLNVQLEDRSYRSFPVTADLEISWGKKMDFVPEYVDLGLPSGTLWATCNVGAYNPEEYGDYFAWGETEPKSDYTWDNYKYGSVYTQLTKYTEDDNLVELLPEDDAATANWGSEWQIPSLAQTIELINICSWTPTTRNNVGGCLVTGPNRNTIFLPYSGIARNGKIFGRGTWSIYWHREVDSPNDCDQVYPVIEISADGVIFEEPETRCTGMPVRPVRKKTTGTAKRTNNINVRWVQLWKNGPKFAEYNVGAANNKAEDYGGYYSWGGSQDKVTSDYNTGTAVLSGDNDTATKLWGSNWRMPTRAELQALIDNCDVEWTTNYNGTGIIGGIFTGKNDYSSNSVFFPAAGIYSSSLKYQGIVGYYWSSTPDDDENACCFFIDSDENPEMTEGGRNCGSSVRAVLAEE